MGYSGFYSPDRSDYPLQCVHEVFTGQECPSCGLSHGFSLILRGRVAEAADWNRWSMRIFLFFALQLILRISLPVIWSGLSSARERDNLVVSDTVITLAMFLLAFFPLLRFWFYMLGSLF